LSRRWIDVYTWSIEEPVVTYKKDINRRIGMLSTTYIVRNTLKANRDSSSSRTRRWIEAEFFQINDGVPGKNNLDANAQLLQRQGQSTNDVSQAADLGEWDALRRHHNDVQRLHPLTSSFARWVALTTALIKVTRRPPSSSSRIPSIVHPAGVVTMSFSFAGCSPVSSTMLEAPSTICAAN